MEALHEPAEEVIATTMPSFFDPHAAPDEWLPFLAMWVDLGWLVEWVIDEMGELWLKTWYGQLRELVVHAPYLSRWRGTARGLERFLEVATGVLGFKVEDDVRGEGGRPFHIVVRAPGKARPYRALIEKIVAMEKPAYVTCDEIKWVKRP
jgi:phage tail-like protein